MFFKATAMHDMSVYYYYLLHSLLIEPMTWALLVPYCIFLLLLISVELGCW